MKILSRFKKITAPTIKITDLIAPLVVYKGQGIILDMEGFNISELEIAVMFKKRLPDGQIIYILDGGYLFIENYGQL